VRFRPTDLDGVFLIDLDVRRDSRGWFCRTFELELFAEQGLATEFPHHNLVFNETAGTLRGLHYQLPPRAEVKVVQCITGAIYDVLVDLRPDSPTYRRWEGFALEGPDRLLYVPIGFAHGYQVTKDSTMISYLMGDVYAPELQQGIRWDDPSLDITWPVPPVLNPRDANYPDVDWEEAWPAS